MYFTVNWQKDKTNCLTNEAVKLVVFKQGLLVQIGITARTGVLPVHPLLYTGKAVTMSTLGHGGIG